MSIKMSVFPSIGTNTDAAVWPWSYSPSDAISESPSPRPLFWWSSGNEQTRDQSRAWQIEPPTGSNPWARELNSLRGLTPNWDSYGAPAPSEIAVRNLATILNKLYGFGDELKPSIVPSAEGGCAVCFVDGSRYADIECFNDGGIFAVISDGADSPDVWPVEVDDLSPTLRKIRSYLRA